MLCNYIINNIPCWTIRKLLYRMLGMKIGKNSRIMMKTIVTIPWRVNIGSNTTINENCYIDGRGGVKIGNNVTIALFSMLITGSHRTNSAHFDFYAEPITIEDNVWIAARAIVLNGCTLKQGSVIGAGSVVKPHTVCEENSVYSGIPAEKTSDRNIEGVFETDKWYIHFR